ncbi:DUF2140 family protein [Streptococcus sp. X16XC17]|uniref:YpmS family protein n=1 Tax=unclassified Streptococcus TaxID=2608887 RepID=UPI00066FCC1F|nr:MULTISPECIES: YpmS family protein [unclassified Streptococcus]TCD46014.1 DUF2140 family protein [Streptococcus sp. X16XC17]
MKQNKSGQINRPKNGWKWAFLLLLSSIMALGIVLFDRIQTPREDTSRIARVETEADTKIGTFSTTRSQLNDTIVTYLESYQTDQFSYKLYATNQFMLFEGIYELLGARIPLYIYFQPSKLEDGSVLLRVSEISVGTLSLPRKEVFNYLKKHYKFPYFVTLDEEKATVHVQLNEIKNSLKIYVKANTIDLYNDQIIFDIYRKK